MLNRCLNIFVQSSAGLVFALSLDRMLKPGKNKIPKRVRIFSWAMVFFIMTAIRVPLDNAPSITKYTSLFFIVSASILLYIEYEGSVWKRYGAILILFMCQCLGEAVTLFVLQRAGMESMSMDFSQMDMVIGSLGSTIFSSCIMFISSSIWRFCYREKDVLRHTWFWIIVILVQHIPVLIYYEEMWKNRLFWNRYCLVLVVSYVCSMALILVLFGFSEKNEIKLEMEEIERQMSLEQVTYSDIEEKRELMAKIRHDYNNQLSSVLALIHMKRTKEAEKMLTELVEKLDEAEENVSSKEGL